MPRSTQELIEDIKVLATYMQEIGQPPSDDGEDEEVVWSQTLNNWVNEFHDAIDPSEFSSVQVINILNILCRTCCIANMNFFMNTGVITSILNYLEPLNSSVFNSIIREFQVFYNENELFIDNANNESAVEYNTQILWPLIASHPDLFDTLEQELQIFINSTFVEEQVDSTNQNQNYDQDFNVTLIDSNILQNNNDTQGNGCSYQVSSNSEWYF